MVASLRADHTLRNACTEQTINISRMSALESGHSFWLLRIEDL